MVEFPSEGHLAEYTRRQLENLFPDGTDRKKEIALLRSAYPIVRIKMLRLINEIRYWRNDFFDPMHSTQYTIYLYLVAREIVKAGLDTDTPTRLFYLNKVLNGIDLYYEIEMPEIFFLGHTSGIVFAKAVYNNHLIIYQNSTIGRSGKNTPRIGPRVCIFPNTLVIGKSEVGSDTIVSAGVSLINTSVPSFSVVRPNGVVEARSTYSGYNPFEDVFRSVSA
jgi:serine O-acetyltransferase